MNTNVSVRDKFFLWLSKKVSPAQLSEYCMACIDIEKFCLQEKILDKKLFEITDFNFIGYLMDFIGSNTVYKKFRAGYGHNLNKVNAALKYYRDFLKANFEILDNNEKVAAAKIESTADKNLSKTDKYAEILSKFFGEDGYKLGKIISCNRFKNFFFDEYGEKCEDSAEQIEEILKSIGTQRDNRIFPKQNENQNKLLDVIVNDIVSAFEAGASAVFVEAVYDKYKKPLADNLKIYNAETCATLILEKADRKFFRYYKEYFSPRIRKATPQEDILRLLKETSGARRILIGHGEDKKEEM